MIQLILIILLAFLSAINTLTTTDRLILYDDGKKLPRQIFRKNKRVRITKKLIILVVTFFGTIGVSIWQYYDNQNREVETKRSAEVDQDRRDSIAEVKSNRRNESTVRTITKALAEYNLNYDSVNQRIIKTLKDTLLSRRAVLDSPAPVLTICGDFEKSLSLSIVDKFSYKLQIPICSNDAGSTNFKVEITLIMSNSLSDSSDYILVDQFTAIPFSLKIPASQSFVTLHRVPIYNIPTDNFLIILLKGTYTSIGHNKTHDVDQLYFLNIKGNTNGMISGETEKNIRNFIRRHDK